MNALKTNNMCILPSSLLHPFRPSNPSDLSFSLGHCACTCPCRRVFARVRVTASVCICVCVCVFWYRLWLRRFADKQQRQRGKLSELFHLKTIFFFRLSFSPLLAISIFPKFVFPLLLVSRLPPTLFVISLAFVLFPPWFFLPNNFPFRSPLIFCLHFCHSDFPPLSPSRYARTYFSSSPFCESEKFRKKHRKRWREISVTMNDGDDNDDEKYGNKRSTWKMKMIPAWNFTRPDSCPCSTFQKI